MELNTDLYQHPKLVTVFGGSGFVGRHVVEALTKRGYRVRIATRRPGREYYMLQIGEVGQTHMLTTNVRNRDSVARALIGADAAVFLPGLLYSSGKNNFKNVQALGAKNVAELSKSAGIPLIHMSALSADLASNIEYARTKGEGEKFVRSAHPNAIIMRPSVIFGPEDHFFNKFSDIARMSMFMPLFGGGKTKLQPVYVGDIATFIVKALDGGVPAGQTYELGGSDMVDFRETMDIMLSIIGRQKKFMNVPWGLGVLMGGLFGLFGKIPMMPTITTAGQIKMLKHDCIVSESAKTEGRTLEGVGIKPQTMEAILPAYLWRFRPQGQFSKNFAV